ncbi:hypothetical protein RYX36_025089 [Vicia faba]
MSSIIIYRDVSVVGAEAYSYDDEVIKKTEAKGKPGLVEITAKQDSFIFTVESTGAVKASQLLLNAIEIVKQKLDAVRLSEDTVEADINNDDESLMVMKVSVVGAEAYSYDDEVIKKTEAKGKPGLVEITAKQDSFIFTVESTGAVKASQLLLNAIEIVKQKLDVVRLSEDTVEADINNDDESLMVMKVLKTEANRAI